MKILEVKDLYKSYPNKTVSIKDVVNRHYLVS